LVWRQRGLGWSWGKSAGELGKSWANPLGGDIPAGGVGLSGALVSVVNCVKRLVDDEIDIRMVSVEIPEPSQ
jgi:hypothetical protein